MPENEPPNAPIPQPEPWATVEPTTSTAHVAGVRTHTGHPSHAAPPKDPTRRVAEHLRLLGILNYVYAGLQGLGLLFGLFYIGLGLVFVYTMPAQAAGQPTQPGGPPPAMFGWLFVGIGAIVVVFSGVLITLTTLSARDLMRHRRRVFCFVVAALHCLNIPLGAVLGIFTIIILSKPEAQALFERNAKRD